MVWLTLPVVGASTLVRSCWRRDGILTRNGKKSFHGLLFRQCDGLLSLAVISLSQAQAYGVSTWKEDLLRLLAHHRQLMSSDIISEAYF